MRATRIIGTKRSRLGAAQSRWGGGAMRLLLAVCAGLLLALAPRVHAQGNTLSDADRAAIAAELAKSGNVVFAGLTESRIDNPAVGSGSDGQSGDLYGQVIAVNGNTAIVGAPNDNIGQNSQQGSAYVFVRSGTAWSLQAKLAAPDGRASDNFGYSVALSGDTAVVGAYQHSIHTGYREGAAYVFVRVGTTWTMQQALSASDGSACGNGQFGYAVAVSGDTALIGEMRNCTLGYGVAHVFERSGSSWSEQAALHASDAAMYDSSYFGAAVALDGDIAVVGAWQWLDGASTRPGSAYVFKRSGANWTQQAQLFSDDNEANAYFGNSVAISGTTVAVSAPAKTVGSNTSQGAVYVYVQSGASWSMQQTITSSDGVSGGYFGTYGNGTGNGITLSADTLAIGASNGVSGISGARAYVFTRASGTWTQRKIIRGGAGNVAIGSGGLALDGTTLVAGGPNNPDCGLAFVQTGSGASWNAQGTLDRGCSPAYVYSGPGGFGAAVAVDGDTAVVGSSTGYRVSGSYQGRVYVFTRQAGGWTLQQQLVANDAVSSDWFGTSVAIASGRIAIGAPSHQNGAPDYTTGTVYVFVRSGSTWTQEAALTRSTNTGYSGFGASVALTGDTLLAGSVSDAGVYGAAYVFTRSGSSWTQQAMLTASDGEYGAQFGSSVALNGPTALVGARNGTVGSHASQGSVYVFARSGTSWAQQQKLVAADGNASDGFGTAVALDGDTAAIGAPQRLVGSSTTGQVYVWQRSGTNWSAQATLSESGSQQYGSSVAIEGDTLAVGAPHGYQYLGNGGAYVYWRSGTAWSQHDELADPSATSSVTYDYFGNSVAISGGLIFIGAPVVGGRSPYGNPGDGAAFAYAYVEATTTTITGIAPEPSHVGTAATVSVTVDAERVAATSGSVSVTASTGESCTISALEGTSGATTSTGSCAITFATLGARTLTASYSGAATYDPSTSAAATHDVDKAVATLAIASVTPEPSVVGQPYAVTVTLAGSFNASGTITVDDGGTSCTITLPATSCNLTSASAGARTITASYAGDALNLGASASAAHGVDKAATMLAISSDTPDPSEAGQPYAVAVALTVAAPGGGAPSGTISVGDGTDTCSIALPATSCTLTSTTTGNKTLVASYAGDANFLPSISPGEPHAVGNHLTTTAITGTTPAPSVVGQAVSVAYSVGASSGTPTGTVTVSAASGETCSATVAAGACTLTFASAGTKSLTATYAGDSNFEASSGSATHVVGKGNTGLTLAATPEPSVVGQAISVAVTVAAAAPASGTPGGSVQVTAGTLACTATLSAGSGACSLTPTSPGSLTIAASYAGDANFNSSTGSVVHAVDKGAVNVTVGETPATSVVGQAFTVNVAVAAAAPASGTPGGTVAVSAGSANCTATLSAGSGSCSLTATAAGSLTVSASYSGDGSFNSGTGSHAHAVGKAATTLAISSDTPDPSDVGQPYTVAVALAVTAPGAGTPGGSISVSDGAATCSIALPASSCALTSTTAGNKTLVATYAGDANFQASTSPGATHAVNGRATTTTITATTPATSVVGQAVSVAYSVTAGSGTPTGSVTVSAASGETCSATVAAGACSLTFASAGTKALTASYAANGDYAASSGSGSHVVDKGSVGVVLSSTPAASVVGQPLAVTVTVAATAPASGTPTGNVQVVAGASSCSAALSGGHATCSITPTHAGGLTIQASYAGDANFESGSGSAEATIAKAATTLVIVSDSPDPSTVGAPVEVVVALTVNAPGAGTPSGTIAIGDGVDSCTVTLPATHCSVSFSTPGERTLEANYAGDADFAASAATATHQVGVSANLSIHVDDGVDQVRIGDPVVYAIVVGNAGPQDVTGAHVADALPSELHGATWTCSGTAGGECPASGSGDIDELVDLPAGASVTFVLAATLGEDAGDTLVNQATVTAPAGTTDPDAADNSSSDTDVVAIFRDGFDGDGAALATQSLAPLGLGTQALRLDIDDPASGMQVLLSLADEHAVERARLAVLPTIAGRVQMLWLVHVEGGAWQVAQSRSLAAGEPVQVGWTQVKDDDDRYVAKGFVIVAD